VEGGLSTQIRQNMLSEQYARGRTWRGKRRGSSASQTVQSLTCLPRWPSKVPLAFR